MDINVGNVTNSLYQVVAKEMAKQGLVSVYGEHSTLVRERMRKLVEELVNDELAT